MIPIKKWLGTTKGQRYLLLAFFAVHVVLSFTYISRQSITHDEPYYIEYAKRWLHGHPERVHPLDDSKTPVVAIAWLPRITRQLLQPNYQLTDFGRKDQREGRYIMLIFSLLVAWYVYRWCVALYGRNGWQWPLLLLLLDPLFLSYSAIITSDMASGAFLIMALFHYRSYLQTAHLRQLWTTAMIFGLGLVTKQTFLFAIPMFIVMGIVHRYSESKYQSLKTLRLAFHNVLFVAVVLLVINAAFFFQGTLQPLSALHFSSNKFQMLQHSLSPLSNVRVPLPASWIQSLDMLQYHAELGAGHPQSTYPGVYIWGNWSMKGGLWYYYIGTLLFKMPLGTMVLMLSAFAFMVYHFRVQAFALRYQFLVIPIVVFGVVLSFLNPFQIGIRHVLLIYPLLFVGLGRLLSWSKDVKPAFYVGVALSCWTVISTFLQFPNLLSYTNELAGSNKTVYEKLADSSIDYGQADEEKMRFLSAHPGYAPPPLQPAPGRYIISIHDLVYGSRSNEDFGWLRNYKAVDVYKGVLLLYDIDNASLRETKKQR